MNTVYAPTHSATPYPVRVHVVPALENRNRLTVAFRPLLAIPHMLLVGGPLAAGIWWTSYTEPTRYDWAATGGVLGAVAVVAAVISWFAILFTGRHPHGLYRLAALYLRWRVRAIAYMALLRDDYPPFEDTVYPAWLELHPPASPRDRVSVGFRLILILPHLVALWLLGFVWAISAIIAWFAILITGRLPMALAEFGTGVLRWNIRVEAYALLLEDEYPPFSLEN